MRIRKCLFPSAILLVLLLSGCGPAPENAPVKEQSRPASLFVVPDIDTGLQRQFPATVEAWRSATLAFRVPGTLELLPAQAGLEVKQGDLLAQLDSTDFRRILTEREARFELAQIRFDQQQSLLSRNYTSEVSLDEARAELKAARAALEIARDNLSYTRLHAPFSGTVSRLQTENFQQVQAQQPVLLLQDERQLDIRFGVPESIISRLRPELQPDGNICGQVRFTAHPKHEFTACYAEHESVSDVSTRTYEVVFRMPQPEVFPAHSGMSVELTVDLAPLLQPIEIKGVPVPVSAVFMHEQQHWVWRLDAENRARRLEVTPVQIRGNHILVNGDLQTGDQLVMAGVSQVREGMKLHPIPQERGL
ncbi:efflux RND transporter periplasmic adaptor subunit [Marinobacterium sediminicola]|uniref:RND family efflux transporter, MFP subunit n=1 Tax=Marinobacterium sediminicola TaxID=518898 RepID=A0ABY1RZV3_9GAMM|nr:efflux RND transporter periplasmic adaptor subunit [Marinobacterium sediminicola]ULG69994.1 efflux RND transporter periplasmic adaptor subunit [Marinobacterium sediminicola]SMR74448.1 RND family efflux transporter, MFP subunit [Marinobacterium sediminicola]